MAVDKTMLPMAEAILRLTNSPEYQQAMAGGWLDKLDPKAERRLDKGFDKLTKETKRRRR